jgi:hypothetical protein
MLLQEQKDNVAKDNFNVIRPEWVEWDSELPYNKCRTATFYNGNISIYQASGAGGLVRQTCSTQGHGRI